MPAFAPSLLWESPPSILRLPHDDVHVWSVRLDLPDADVQRLGKTLSRDELARAERHFFDTDRRNFVACRGILRTLIGHYFQVEPGQLQFAHGPHGKPYLSGEPRAAALQFNLSHSQDFALFAFAWGRAVGVDVEHIRPLPNLGRIVQRFFSVREKASFRALPKVLRHEAFFHWWTCMEAYLKATGGGLAGLREHFDIVLGLDGAVGPLCVRGEPDGARTWWLQTLTPATGYTGAVAVEDWEPRLTCRFYSLHEPATWCREIDDAR